MIDLFKKSDEFYSIEELNENTLKLILSYEKDGQYVLASAEELKQMPIDARYDALWNSIYHACKLFLNYYSAGHKEIYNTYKKCLNKCLEVGFMCEGFTSECSTMNIIKELIELGLLETIPVNSKEAKKLESIIDSYRDISDNYPSLSSLKDLLAVYDRNIIFTYGTLMKGNSNHFYLKDDEYIGDSSLEDYGLLELGSFPGAIKKEGYKVTGEIYKVSDEEKSNIDYLEGDLYSYRNTYLRSKGKLYYVGFYEYNYPEEKERCKFRIPYGKWNKEPFNTEKYVWYVCYGSNLSYRRFMRYINRCNEKLEPLAKENIILPYNIYFAGYTSLWDGAKAFLDINNKGKSYCVKYLITKKQYEEVKEMEGSDYKTKVELGFDRFGIMQYSFTATNSNMEEGIPSEKYIEEIKRGIKENYSLKDDEIEKYLRLSF